MSDGASAVRILSSEEIAELVREGKITPVEQIRYANPPKLISNEAEFDYRHRKYLKLANKI